MTPGLRKFALTAHVTSSVGWLGAVAAFLALAVAGLAVRDAQTGRASYLSMELIGWYVIVPLCVASLLTGLVQSLVTHWGLFLRYWVLVKFLITVVSASILFVYTKTLGQLGALAADATLPVDGLRNHSPVVHSGAALLALVVTSVLSVYKPWGMTRRGLRKQDERRRGARPNPPPPPEDVAAVHDRRPTAGTSRGLYALLGVLCLALLLFVGLHLAGVFGHGGH